MSTRRWLISIPCLVKSLWSSLYSPMGKLEVCVTSMSVGTRFRRGGSSFYNSVSQKCRLAIWKPSLIPICPITWCSGGWAATSRLRSSGAPTTPLLPCGATTFGGPRLLYCLAGKRGAGPCRGAAHMLRACLRSKSIWRIWEAWRAGDCLGDGQTETEVLPSQGGRGDALLRRMFPYLTWLHTHCFHTWPNSVDVSSQPISMKKTLLEALYGAGEWR